MRERLWFEVHGKTFWPLVAKPYDTAPLHGFAYRVAWWARMTSRTQALAALRVPFGWKAVPPRETADVLVMPLWVYPFYHLSLYWRTYLYGPLVRLGFWDLDEGDYYINGHWSWRWWETLNDRRREIERWTRQPFPASRWECFGWWIQRRLDDYNGRVPSFSE